MTNKENPYPKDHPLHAYRPRTVACRNYLEFIDLRYKLDAHDMKASERARDLFSQVPPAYLRRINEVGVQITRYWYHSCFHCLKPRRLHDLVTGKCLFEPTTFKPLPEF